MSVALLSGDEVAVGLALILGPTLAIWLVAVAIVFRGTRLLPEMLGTPEPRFKKSIQVLPFLVDGFDWSGSTSRGRFRVVLLVQVLFLLVSILLLEFPSRILQSIAILILAILAVPSVGYQVRRLHDAGRSGSWVMLGMVPPLGLLVVLYLVVAQNSGHSWKAMPRVISGAGYLATLGLAAVILSRLFWEPYWTPSSSMKPTLLPGDYFIASSYFRPDRGDVVVFRHPTKGVAFVMRLVGLPGDRIQVKAGILHINERASVQQAVGNFTEIFGAQGPMGSYPACANSNVAVGSECQKEVLTETLPSGARHSVLNIRDSILDNTPVYTVPMDHYFLMGDNRDNVVDSRVPHTAGGVGFVPVGNLTGRADFVLFSSSGRHWLHFRTWRLDRLVTPIE